MHRFKRKQNPNESECSRRVWMVLTEICVIRHTSLEDMPGADNRGRNWRKNSEQIRRLLLAVNF